MAVHNVRTTHIQGLIHNSLGLAKAVDGQADDALLAGVDVGCDREIVTVPEAIEVAVADLRHAADELDRERLSCYGWPQV